MMKRDDVHALIARENQSLEQRSLSELIGRDDEEIIESNGAPAAPVAGTRGESRDDARAEDGSGKPERKTVRAAKGRGARKARRASSPAAVADRELVGGDVAEMYRHWKRIHEISGTILASLEQFSEEMKTFEMKRRGTK